MSLKPTNTITKNKTTRRKQHRWDLTALLNAADAAAPRPYRHLWLIRLVEWISGVHGKHHGPEWAKRRVQHLLNVLERHPPFASKVASIFQLALTELDARSLWADTGFAPSNAFFSELSERLRRHCLPETPDTSELGQLLRIAFSRSEDVAWLATLDDAMLQRIVALFQAHDAKLPDWQPQVLDSLTVLASEVHTAGNLPALRIRMDAELLRHRPFDRVNERLIQLSHAINNQQMAQATAICDELRVLLTQCRAAANSIHAHMNEFGISINLIFTVHQLCERTQRMQLLIDALPVTRPSSLQSTVQLLANILQQDQQRRGLRALFAHHYSMLSRKVAERSGDIGAHYITHSRAEYWQMLRRATVGGGVLALTTFAKFMIAALGLSLFWGGWWAGVNYALSFVVILLLHGVIATKQPAMTAASIAASLKDVDHQPEVTPFVGQVAGLVRSQLAGILGNLLAVTPVVLAIQWLCWQLAGGGAISMEKAQHVLHENNLLGPSVLFAMFTGVILFAGSLIAGWTENWFLWHRLDSAIAWNPRIISLLGSARAQRWSTWWRTHISNMAANISLGLMLGLVPVSLQFFGLPLEVRHVTLVTGQIMAAAGSLGREVLHDANFWWAVAAIPLIGLANLTTSFLLALRVALRARHIRIADQRRLLHAILSRLRRHPREFLLPPRN